MKKLTIIHYGTILEENNEYYTNHQFYNILEESIKHYSTTFVGTTETDKSNFYINGKRIYNYKIDEKVNIEFLNQPSLYTFFKKLKNLFKNIKKIQVVIKKTDKIFIFIPGYTGLIASLISIYYKKQLILYVGANWRDISKFQIQKTFKLIAYIYKQSYLMFEKVIVKRANLIITAGNQLYSIYSKNNKNVFETKPMLHVSKSDKLNQGVNNSDIQILYVGSIQERKGLINLINAIDMLSKDNISIILTMIGHAEINYKNKLMNKIQELSIENSIIFKDYISDPNVLQNYYNNSDMFIIPTYGEGFPRVIYEAMLNKLPVLASNIDSIRDNLTSDDCLLFFNNDNQKDISDKIKFLMSNKDYRNTIIENGYNFAINKVGNEDPYRYLFKLINSCAK